MTNNAELADLNQRVIAEFRANQGQVGGPYQGRDLILIHHVGARSGATRVNPLVYFPDGDRMVIAASKAGAATRAHPGPLIAPQARWQWAHRPPRQGGCEI